MYVVDRELEPRTILRGGDELHVTLQPLSSAHRSKALVALCAELNRDPVRFPGSRLRLHYAVAPFADTSPVSPADRRPDT